jgi:hypothetical protein
MKKCSYCGKEYPDEATICEMDGEALAASDAQPPLFAESQNALAAPSNAAEALRARSQRDMLVGGLWCGGGILVTALTYSSAANGGGSYVVAWGAILFGGVQFLRGLSASFGTGKRN